MQALRCVNFRITQGEFVAIIGALDVPSDGVLNYRGKVIAEMSDPLEYRAREVGIVFQSFHLLPTFTAMENVQLPMFETSASASERTARAKMVLKSVGLEHRQDHFPAKLSGGERQRVAIARSLANGPSVLLADEPTGNLDSENAVIILDLIIRLHRENNMTLVLLTHDMTIAQRAS